LSKDQLRLPSSVAAVYDRRRYIETCALSIDGHRPPLQLHRRPAVDGYLMNGSFDNLRMTVF